LLLLEHFLHGPRLGVGRSALGSVSIHADGVDRAQDADAVGQPLQTLDRTLLVDVDSLGPQLPGLFQAVGQRVDGEDPAGPEEPRTDDREQSDRPAPEHGDGVAGLDLGDIGR
jgi:hypothetical protein